VAFIKALSRLRERLGDKDLSPREILHLGYHLEDAVGAGKCGIQDQAAAVSGVNLGPGISETGFLSMKGNLYLTGKPKER
jgi:hypothetical protein